ncbi:hypothetical protein ACH429_18815 [Streptomyces pathocidini]|uniref:Uncharacterized protein n=2 Tax=Streptomyces pathocidini TaxID=1650571 RepID=A0ABW7UU40_9ACTN
MTEHFADDTLALLARTGADTAQQGHLDACRDCRGQLAVWQGIGAALRAEAAEEAVAVPSFETLIAPALAAPAPAPDGPVVDGARRPAGAGAPAGSSAVGRPFPAPWRLAWQLALRQAALLPRIWAPLSAAGFIGAAVLGGSVGQERLGMRLFGAVCVLLVLFGALLVASPRRDPRRELLFTLPVRPASVFLARLSVVLCVDLLLAVVCSAVIGGPGWWPVVASWLGEALLASSLALALSVRIAPAAGAAAGGALWLLGVVGGPEGLLTTPLDGLLDALLSTTPWTLAASALLLAWTTSAMRTFTTPTPAP